MEQRSFLDLNDVFATVQEPGDRHAIRNFNFMNKQRPASVGQLAYDLGFEVRHENLPKGVSAHLEPDTWSRKGFELVVNSNEGRLRQRFSALHEIAHYYLHNPDADDIAEFKHRASSFGDAWLEKTYSPGELIEEYEANSWADAAIFGDQALVAISSMLGKDLQKLSRHFGFSEQVVKRAMQRRNLL